MRQTFFAILLIPFLLIANSKDKKQLGHQEIILEAGLLIDRLKPDKAIATLSQLSDSELKLYLDAYLEGWAELLQSEPNLRNEDKKIKKLILDDKKVEALAEILSYWWTSRIDQLDEQHWNEFQQACKSNPILPNNLEWKTSEEPAFTSPKAIRGGAMRYTILAYPLTFRTVGLNSNSSSRGIFEGNDMPLVKLSLVTGKPIPAVATHWAIGDDKKSVYFKLDPDAKWSDGHSVTADDFLHQIYFHRTPYIRAGWYNTYYNENFAKVVKYDDHTISVHRTKATETPLIDCSLKGSPSHFYGRLNDNFTQDYDWKIVPNTGAYQLTKMVKGKQLQFTRKKKWWANNKKYYKYRYNPDSYIYTVNPDVNTLFSQFLNGELSIFQLNKKSHAQSPELKDLVEKGYVHKLRYQNSKPKVNTLVSMNKQNAILANKDVRVGIAHALNIEGLITELLPDGVELSHTINVGYGKFTNQQVRRRPYNLSKAKAHFAEAGFTTNRGAVLMNSNGQKLSFTLYCDEANAPRAEFLKKHALKAGVEFVIVSQQPNQTFRSLLDKKHDLAIHCWQVTLKENGPIYWGQYASICAYPDTNNFTNTADEKLDQLISSYQDATDLVREQELSREIQQWIHDDAAAIPLFHGAYSTVVFWRVLEFPKGYAKKESYHIFSGGLYWVDEKREAETKKAMSDGTTFPKVDISIKFY